MIKKVLLILAGLVAIAVVGFLIYTNSAPPLPPGADEIIDEVLRSDLPELVTGKTGKVMSGEIGIWYESISPEEKPKAAVLLIMGLGGHALVWPDYFYRPMVDAGYQVVRFDNRGVGMSDWMENWSEERSYTLQDMAADGIAVLDGLGVERAHVVGASLGGMIAQQMAISHPGRLLSLTSMMSSGYVEDPELPLPLARQFSKDFMKTALKYSIPPTERNAMRLFVGVWHMLEGNGDYELDIKGVAETTLYEMRKRRGLNPKATEQQSYAAHLSGSRYDQLRQINVPTLIVHGTADPLLSLAHGEKYAPMIPGAQTLWVEDGARLPTSLYAPDPWGHSSEFPKRRQSQLKGADPYI